MRWERASPWVGGKEAACESPGQERRRRRKRCDCYMQRRGRGWPKETHATRVSLDDGGDVSCARSRSWRRPPGAAWPARNPQYGTQPRRASWRLACTCRQQQAQGPCHVLEKPLLLSSAVAALARNCFVFPTASSGHHSRPSAPAPAAPAPAAPAPAAPPKSCEGLRAHSCRRRRRHACAAALPSPSPRRQGAVRRLAYCET